MCLNVFKRYHNIKNGKEASEDTEESPAGRAGEGKQNKGNQQKRIRPFKENDNKHHVRNKVLHES